MQADGLSELVGLRSAPASSRIEPSQFGDRQTS
jgi:hypothetical protein